VFIEISLSGGFGAGAPPIADFDAHSIPIASRGAGSVLEWELDCTSRRAFGV
jgi:hypothetical protein